MSKVQRLPDPSTWRFVLVHNVIRHGIPQIVANSRSTTRSFLALHHGEAKPTICISDPYLRDRAIRLGGWTEITAEVGPDTPKCWDEERARWKPDVDGLLPWERKPGAKTEMLSVRDEVMTDEVKLLPPPAPPKGQAKGPTPRAKE